MKRREFIQGLVSLGALSALCPHTLAASAKESSLRGRIEKTGGEQYRKSTCVHCVNFCGIDVKLNNGVMSAIYPDTARAPYYNVGICPKGASGLFNSYNPYRIKKPLIRTNPKKGLAENPGWKEISWDQAFSLISERMQKIRRDNPAKLIWQHGHGKYLIGDKFPKAFAEAFGTPNLVHRTTTCEAARHVADELTWGYHGFLPDLNHCRLLLNFGGNYFEAEQFARWLDHASTEAVENGMKTIVIEPRLSVTAAKAREWIPIRPAKDVVLLLGMARLLIAHGYIDEEFLIEYTNAPVLVDADGSLLKNAEGGELVWDAASQTAKVYSDDVKPSLKGEFQYQGRSYKTSFQVFSDSLADITPEYVEQVSDVKAEKVQALALELGQQARIGSTINIDGETLRYRPVAIHTFRGLSAKQYGVQNWRAALMVQMLLGSIDAVGGINLHSVYKKPKYFKASKAEYPPTRIDLQESVFFPHATHNVAQQVAFSLQDGKRFGLDYTPEMQIFYATNRPFSCPDGKQQFDSMGKTFNVAIDIVMSETAIMSDIVLPDLTYLESWHLSPTRYTPYSKHTAIRQPMANVYDIEHDGFSILWELAKRLDIRDQYIKNINKNWGLKDYPLHAGKDYSAKQAVEKLWLQKSKGKPLSYAEQHAFIGKHLSTKETYLNGVEAKFKGTGKPKMKFYTDQLVETFEKVKKQVEKHRIKGIDLAEYQRALSPIPLKEHAFPVPHLKAKDYPFYLITYKRMYRNQSANTATNPILNQLGNDVSENFILINAATAEKMKITSGDAVYLETPVGKAPGKVKITQGIRPDTLAVSYHYGQQSMQLPNYAKKGIWINGLLESHADPVSGMDSFNDSKCRLYKM